MNIESALTKRIGEAGAKLHTARSRNDQVALDLWLYVKEQIEQASALLQEIAKSAPRSRHGNVVVRICHDCIEPGRVWTRHPLESEAGAGRRFFVLRVNDSFA